MNRSKGIAHASAFVSRSIPTVSIITYPPVIGGFFVEVRFRVQARLIINDIPDSTSFNISEPVATTTISVAVATRTISVTVTSGVAAIFCLVEGSHFRVNGVESGEGRECRGINGNTIEVPSIVRRRAVNPGVLFISLNSSGLFNW